MEKRIKWLLIGLAVVIFSFAFFDLNNYFKLDVVSDDLSKLDETFNTNFSEYGLLYKEDKSHSILHSFAPKYEVYGNIEILNRKYQITATIVENDHKPTDAYNLDVSQKNSVSVFYESNQRYTINIVVKSSTNIVDDFSVTDPYYHISIETLDANYFVEFSKVGMDGSYTIHYSEPLSVGEVMDLMDTISILNILK